MFETSPILSPCSRSAASTGSVSSYSSKFSACSQRARHLHGAFVGALGVAAHPADDPLREQHPDLLVVVELRMPLDSLDRGRPSVRVPARIELEPEASAERLVALRPEIRARLDEREVDVEEDASAVSCSCF